VSQSSAQTFIDVTAVFAPVIPIVTFMNDCRRSLGLVIIFIDYFTTELVTTLNYSAIADFHTLQITQCPLGVAIPLFQGSSGL
jgi:hypothetical protein